MMPIKISRATNRMEEVKKYYSKDIGVSMVYNNVYSSGIEHAIFMYDSPSKVGI